MVMKIDGPFPIDQEYIDNGGNGGYSKTKRFTDWIKLKEVLQKFDWKWIFRGHTRSVWKLETSLDRCVKNNGGYRIVLWGESAERHLFDEFKSGAGNYLTADHIPIPENTLEWLALMQHHGCPTRLLDFTRSYYIAAFFALEEAYDGDAAIWCINENWCNRKFIDTFNKVYKDEASRIEEGDNLAEEKNFYKLYYGPNPVQMIFPVIPCNLNKRIIVQQGVFLCSGSNQPFLTNMGKMSNEDVRNRQNILDNDIFNILKIVISSEIRKTALMDLNRMNINRAVLFPGLDGYAKGLSSRLWLE